MTPQQSFRNIFSSLQAGIIYIGNVNNSKYINDGIHKPLYSPNWPQPGPDENDLIKLILNQMIIQHLMSMNVKTGESPYHNWVDHSEKWKSFR